MTPNEIQIKQPFRIREGIPDRCPICASTDLVRTNTSLEIDVKHEGRQYRLSIPSLDIRQCAACGERVFDEDVDRQINEALQAQISQPIA